jgi:predicted Zn-ribbon and HTH transcriptional regulator
MEKLLCKRCGWLWVKRIEREPKNCPGCKSPFWNKEYQRKRKEKNRE